METSIFKQLNEQETEQFKKWARDNFNPVTDKASSIWHPVVRQECLVMYQERYPNIKFGYMGNGIVVWDNEILDGMDYRKIAHIEPNRKTNIYTEFVSLACIRYIELYANIADPEISASQKEKVFIQRPFGL
jgi:hypothetical protein